MSEIPTRKPKNSQEPVEAVEARMIEFVQSQIETMKAHLSLGNGGEPSFYDVNNALCSYQNINLALLAMHNTARIEYTKAKERFEDWFAEKYITIRERENPRSLSAQKWLSQKEIELMIRTEYSEEHKQYNWDMIEAEHQLNFMRRLLEAWSAHQFVLTQLSKNLISEVAGLNVDNALNN